MALTKTLISGPLRLNGGTIFQQPLPPSPSPPLTQSPSTLSGNLGNGAGHSVLEVIGSVERVTGRKVPVRFGPRRPGDPAVLVASSELIRREAGWTPRFADLDQIVRTAYEWRLAHPRGYDDRRQQAA